MSAPNDYLPTFSDEPMPSTALDQQALREAGLGAFFRPGQLEALGISYDRLQSLAEEGVVEHVARGLYRLADAEPTEHYTLASVCARVPSAIVCLLSALNVHGIGTQLPREVWLAIHHKAQPPRIPDVKLRLIRFSGRAWTYGIDGVEFEGVPARITSPARTVIDCFRYERLIGREAAMEALHDGLRRRKVTADELDRVLEILPSRRLMAALDAFWP